MNFKYLKTRQVNQTLWVEIHHPPVNFLITDMLEELHILIKKTVKDDSIRVFVLTGGRDDSYIMHFSIAELMMLTPHLRKMYLHKAVRFRITSSLLKYYMTFTNWLMDLFPWYETLTLKIAKAIRGYSSGMFLWYQMMRTYYAIERMNKVTIAAINGSCNGGGTEMAACFDFRFMVGDQRFTIGQPECLIGIIPGGGGTQRATRLIGKARALELMLKAGQFTPSYAKDAGLLTDVFDKKDFHARIQEFADLMSIRPPVAIDAIKKAVTQGLDTSVRHGLSIELAQSVRCFDTADAEMGLKNYLAYIEENVMTLDHEHATTKEFVDLLHKTLDIMENAKLFKPFQGK